MNSSQSPIADPATIAAEAPFNDAEADIILRSSDNVEFRVLKLFLSRASSFFRSMFDLPQGVASSDQEMRDDIPVVAMAEPASVVKRLLQCCYPLAAVGGIAFESVMEIFKLSEAAQKYDVAGVDSIARCAIAPQSGFMANHPFDVYALAAEYKWELEARVAAQKCLLNGPPWNYPHSEIVELVSGGTLRRLDRYFTQCMDTAKSVVCGMPWPSRFTALCSCAGCGRTGSKRIDVERYGNISPNKHWTVYLREVGEFLSRRPLGSTASDANLMITAIGSVECKFCSITLLSITSTMREMATHLEAEIDKAVAKVTLEVKL